MIGRFSFLFLLSFIATPFFSQSQVPDLLDGSQLNLRGNRVFLNNKRLRTSELDQRFGQYEESNLYWKQFKRERRKSRILELTGLIGSLYLLQGADNIFLPQTNNDVWRLLSVSLLDAAITFFDIGLHRKRWVLLQQATETYNQRRIQQFLY
jgi:hypothetical protein